MRGERAVLSITRTEVLDQRMWLRVSILMFDFIELIDTISNVMSEYKSKCNNILLRKIHVHGIMVVIYLGTFEQNSCPSQEYVEI